MANKHPSKIDRNKAISWLNEKWDGEKLCPVCKKNHWHIPDQLVETRPFYGGNLFVGGAIYPSLAITCLNCGNTVFFNAMVAQLLDKADPSPPEVKENNDNG